MASKGISAIMRGTSLKDADPFVKMSITAILSGMASKAAGGDFVQGAMSAMVVWLYNETAAERHHSKMVKMHLMDKKDMPEWLVDPQGNSDKAYQRRQAEIANTLTLSPESKKALLNGLDKASTALGFVGGMLSATGIGVEVGVPLMTLSLIAKGAVIRYNNKSDLIETAELVRDSAIDEAFSPFGAYGVFGAEATKIIMNTYVPIK